METFASVPGWDVHRGNGAWESTWNMARRPTIPTDSHASSYRRAVAHLWFATLSIIFAAAGANANPVAPSSNPDYGWLFDNTASPTVFEVNAFGVTDASTGIDPSTITYTHAVDFNAGGHPANINGLAFYNDTNRSGPGYSLVYPTLSYTGYNSPADNSSQLEGLMANFWYFGTNPRTLTLSGLTPGETYKVRFFIGGYQNRTQTFSTDQGFSVAGVDRGIRGTIASIEHTYTLGPGDTDIALTFASAHSFHWYGFTNELAEGFNTATAAYGSHNGVLKNGPTWSTDTPFSYSGNKSVDFDGSNDFVEMTGLNTALNGASELSVSMWIRSDGSNEDRGFWNGVNPSGADHFGGRYDKSGWLNGNGGTKKLIKWALHINGSNRQYESAGQVQTTAWQHVLMTWKSGTGAKLYINGVLDTPSSSNFGSITGTTSNQSRFIIGDGAKANWKGKIDEAYVWLSELSADNAEYLAANSLNGFDASAGGGVTISYLGSDHVATWRSTSDPKVAAFDPDGDNAYGTDGYAIVNDGTSNGSSMQLLDGTPAYISLTGQTGMEWSHHVYPDLDNATQPISGTVADLWAPGVAYNVNSLPATISFSAAASTDFILTVVAAHDVRSLGNFRVEGTGGTGGTAESPSDTVAGGLRVLFFEVTGVSAGDTFKMSSGPHCCFHGIAFEAISGGGGGGATFCSDVAVTDMIEVKGNSIVTPISGTAVMSTNSTSSNKIKLMNSAAVTSDLYVGVGGNTSSGISVASNATHTGTKAVLPAAEAITTPSTPNVDCTSSGGGGKKKKKKKKKKKSSGGNSCSDLIYNNATVTISSNQHTNRWEAKGNSVITISGDVSIVADHEFKVKDNAQIRLANASTLKVFTTAHAMKFESNAKLNQNKADPSLVTLVMAASNKNIEVKSNSIVYANAINASKELKINSNGKFYGTFRGKKLKLENNGRVYVDTSVCAALTDTLDHFVIAHDGAGIHCLGETVSVTAKDADGDTLTDYTGSIVLDTQSGKGTWALDTGNGTFADATADDGLATYTFVAGDSGVATFSLTYTNGAATINVDAYEGSIRDDDTEGDMTFTPSGLTLTAAALSNPPPSSIDTSIPTQTAGTAFNLHLAAYGTTANDSQCGVIETYTGNKSLRFWVSHSNPASGTLTPTVDGTSIAASAGAAVNQTVGFSSGQATVAVKYKDVGQISIGAKDDTTTSPTIAGATPNFVSKPADFVIVSITNASNVANPGASTPTGTLFARSGEAFSVSVEARDSEGSRTPAYATESPAEGIRLVSSSLVAPAGGRNGTANDGAIENATSFATTTPAGTLTGSTFSWDEVGAIQLRASVADGNYLGTGDVTGSVSGTVGRFAPHHFEATKNAPIFDTACAVGTFTWLDQPFGFVGASVPVITVTALNLTGTRTENYSGSWWRLTNASLTGRNYAANITINQAGLPSTASDPSIAVGGDGTGTLTFSSGSGLKLVRGSPINHFNAEISLSINVLDLDATAYPLNPVVFGGTTSGTGIAFDATKRFQYGRIAVDNASGSELQNIAMPLRTQRYDGLAWVDDTLDSCSSVSTGTFTTTPTPGSLSSTPTIANSPFSSGDAGLVWGAPSVVGTMDVSVDLGSAGLPWLLYDWDLDGSNDDNPSGRVTFGIAEGQERLIYTREVY